MAKRLLEFPRSTREHSTGRPRGSNINVVAVEDTVSLGKNASRQVERSLTLSSPAERGFQMKHQRLKLWVADVSLAIENESSETIVTGFNDALAL